MFDMKRREFIALLGGAAAWPIAARAQQAMPVIGFLHGGSSAGFAPFMPGFHMGLKDAGFAEGQNVTIDYRWADNQYDRLPGMAAELVGRQVAVIFAGGSVLAAKRYSATIWMRTASGDQGVKRRPVAAL
jgi:putative ABC transport system substrate-binding protein